MMTSPSLQPADAKCKEVVTHNKQALHLYHKVETSCGRLRGASLLAAGRRTSCLTRQRISVFTTHSSILEISTALEVNLMNYIRDSVKLAQLVRVRDC